MFSPVEYIRADRKPGSVSDDHPSRTAVACSLMRHTFGRVRAAPLNALFVLLRMGFTRQLCLHSPGELLPHHFNLTTALPVSAECFCCTFPTVTCGGRYPSSLPCGARTFLMHKHAIAWSAQILLYYIPDQIIFNVLTDVFSSSDKYE